MNRWNVLQYLAAARRAEAAADWSTAERHYALAAAAAPTNSAALAGRARALNKLGRPREVVALLERPAADPAAGAPVRAEFGLACGALGNMPSAARALAGALAKDPSRHDLRVPLGDAWVALGRAADAIRVFAEASRHLPASFEIERGLAFAHAMIAASEPAVAHFRAALRLRPDALCAESLGTLLRTLGRFDEATRAYEQALALNPASAEAIAGVADIMESRGAKAEARDQLDVAIRAGRSGPPISLVFARLHARSDRRSEAVAMLRRDLAAPLPPLQRATLLFSLGALLEEDGNHDEAFAAYSAANDLYPKTFDARAHVRLADDLIGTFTPARVASLSNAGSPSDRPVFILGMMRSGTSLVEQMLAAHPRVTALGELDDINTLAHALPQRLRTPARYPSAAAGLTPDLVGVLAAEHLRALESRADPARADRITDKMPANYLHVGLIACLFPRATIIHCTRDPMDTCFSCYATQFSAAHPYTNSLALMAIAYRQYVRLMEHWRTILGVRMLDVSYEKLVADPEAGARAVVEFCGLPWDPVCLRFHESRRVVTTASIDQVRRPVYDSSIGRAARFERHLGALRAGLEST
ncbi:MAG: sulfotransferase [Phycisphaerae bacterium]|nr:sulfotransferase [Phycisphaerae bacterium]